MLRRVVDVVIVTSLALVACGPADEQLETSEQALAQTDRLDPGEGLLSDQSLVSADGQLRLTLSRTCALELVQTPGIGLFNTLRNSGGSNCLATMQTDGNFVVYDRTGGGMRPLWSTGTHRNPGAFLVLHDDGNLVVHQGDRILWKLGTRRLAWNPPNLSHSREDIVWAGEGLMGPRSDSLTKTAFSPNVQLRLAMQPDCNLVLYQDDVRGAHPLWATGTNGQGKRCYAHMQWDGNLVVYSHPEGSGRAQAVWSSKTHGQLGSYLRLQEDGNLVIYRDGKALWATGTRTQPVFPGGVVDQDGNVLLPPGGGPSRPGCRFDPGRSTRVCKFAPDKWALPPFTAFICNDVYVCSDHPHPETQSSGYYFCGVCVKGTF